MWAAEAKPRRTLLTRTAPAFRPLTRMKLPRRCYLCGIPLIPVPSGYRSPLQPNHATRDHVPPDGLFCDPKPTNLITVPCCNEHNKRHSGVDERLRILTALELRHNEGGQRILHDKVFGSTMAKLRQPQFIMELAGSMRDDFVMTRNGPVPVTVFSVPGREILNCAEDIVRGLLCRFHPAFDYYTDKFVSADMHTATIANPQRYGGGQLEIIREITSKVQPEARGSYNEFMFWHEVDLDRHLGIWFLLFYGAVGFLVCHHLPKDLPPLVL